MRKPLRGFVGAILLFIAFASAATGQNSEPAKPPGVRLTFLPPPMEGALCLGVYDKKGRLVRVLAREATEKDFTIGLNGLIMHWDGRDDAGKLAPTGSYEARGFSVGAVEIEGVALHGNDWIEADEGPRPARVVALRAKGRDENEVVLATLDGAEAAWAQRFETEPAVPADDTVTIAEGKVILSRGGESRPFPLGPDEQALDATLGASDRLWLIVQSPAGAEVRAYTLGGEFLRRLAYAPGEPLPRRVLAARGTFVARWSEQILLLEENAQMQRVRSLALPQKPVSGDPPLWETVLEKTIWRGVTFAAIQPLLRRAEGKPFVAEREFVVRLVNNPLLNDEASTARVTVGFDASGSFLQTADGLPLRRITATPGLRWAVIGREGSGKLLTILQSDGAVVEEFRARKLASMMAFDAGDFEWDGK